MPTQETSLLENYIKYGYQKVQGWLSGGAINLILSLDEAQNKFDINGHICEIGVHHGRLFILLYLLTQQDENALAIDVFEKQHLNVDKSGRGERHIFLKNLEYFAKDKHKLRIIEEDSTQLYPDDIKNYVGGEVRLFSIDGGHTASITRQDLTTASNSICEGGIIILDDYFNSNWPGVSEGTNQFMLHDNEREIVPFVIGGNKVFLTTRGHADKYIAYLLKTNLGTRCTRKQQEMFGHRVICFGWKFPGLKTIILEKFKNKLLGNNLYMLDIIDRLSTER